MPSQRESWTLPTSVFDDTRRARGRTPVLVSGWGVSVLLFTDFGTVLVPVLFGEPTTSVT